MIDFLEDIGDLIFGNKRLSALKHFAATKGFQIKRKAKAEQLPLDVQKMQFFNGRKRKSIKGYLYKKDLTFDSFNQIFDYYYSGDFGTSTTSVFLFDCRSLDLPSFIIKPKGSFSKIGSIFSQGQWGVVDKNFDKQFTVESSDFNYMRMMITIQFCEVLLKMKYYTIEGSGNHLVLYKKSAKVDIVDMDNVYDSGLELLDIIIHDNSHELV